MTNATQRMFATISKLTVYLIIKNPSDFILKNVKCTKEAVEWRIVTQTPSITRQIQEFTAILV